VVAVSQGGSTHFAKQRGDEIQRLCEKGFAVCLVDVRGTGETSLGDDRGRGGRATSVSSSHLMLDETLLGLRLHDLRSVLAWLGARADVDGRRVIVWGDSPTAPLDAPAMPIVPHLVDGRPREAEPLGQILALLAALYEPNVRGVIARGGITSISDVLARPAVGVPHDLVVPGVLTRTDLPDLVAALSPLPIRLEGLVDAGNCKATSSQLDSVYGVARLAYRKDNAESKLAVSESRDDSLAETLSDWIAK
ncbi:MAG TPA: hypothetical protein PLV92_02425, partial [Pirellulaceae bacterium]|nr:hypothetical protein [Pirellulaceae bacterium]